MQVRIPKPMHGWRAFTGEVGIIVLGVLIALAFGQIVDAWQWHQKVQAAERTINFELSDELYDAAEVVRFSRCVEPYVEALERAIVRHDRATIQKLHDVQPPFKLRAWRSTAWQTAMSTGVADHFPPERVSQYSYLFTGFDDARALQQPILSNFTDATAGRISPLADQSATQSQLAAAERFKAQLAFQADISQFLLETARSGGEHGEDNWPAIARTRDLRRERHIEREGAMCEQSARSIASDGKE